MANPIRQLLIDCLETVEFGVCYFSADLNYLEQASGGPDLTVATLPKSGKIVLIQVRTK